MKNFILDTNVLLFEPSSIYKFGESTVIIPLVVLEEVDKFKVVVIDQALNFPFPFGLNYPELPDSCPGLKLSFTINVNNKRHKPKDKGRHFRR